MKKTKKLDLLLLILVVVLLTTLMVGKKRINVLLKSNLSDYNQWTSEHGSTKEVDTTNLGNLDMFYKKTNSRVNISTLILGDELTIGNVHSSDLATFDKSFINMLKTQYTVSSTFRYIQEANANVSHISELFDADKSIENFDLAVISLGKADFDNHVSIEEFSQKYTDLICKLKSRNYKCSIIALIPPSLNSDNEYNSTIKSICDSNNIDYVDIDSCFINSGYDPTDLIEGNVPTPLGYRTINLEVNNLIIKNS